jgi:glutamate synthase domain-containing protein 3
MDEVIGMSDRLNMRPALDHWKARGLDFTNMLRQVVVRSPRRRVEAQNHRLDRAFDVGLMDECREAIVRRRPVTLDRTVRNVDRAVGTMLGSEVTRMWGGKGLPDDTITVRCTGSAGQSFGAFVPRGVTLRLEGEANDYVGKGLSGGRLILVPPRTARFAAEDNVIAGNVVLFGATGGEAYIRGIAGERFAVRNSGAVAVVEGVGDHGCEYMTGGRVAVLGRTGRNFAAGMSGGIAYVLDVSGAFADRCNCELVDLEHVESDEDELRALIERHAVETGSAVAERLLTDWSRARRAFVKVMPRDYRAVIAGKTREPLKVVNG